MAESAAGGDSSKNDQENEESWDDKSWELIDMNEITSDENKDITQEGLGINQKEKHGNPLSSPLIKSLRSIGNGHYQIQVEGKIYTLPFQFTMKPEVRTDGRFHYLVQNDVCYKLKRDDSGSLCVQNKERGALTKLNESSEDLMHGRGGNSSDRHISNTSLVEAATDIDDPAELTSDGDEEQKPAKDNLHLLHKGDSDQGSEDGKEESIIELKNGRFTSMIEKHQIQYNREDAIEGKADEADSDQTVKPDRNPTDVELEEFKHCAGTSSTVLSGERVVGASSINMTSGQEANHTCKGDDGASELGQSEKLTEEGHLDLKRNAVCKMQDINKFIENKDDTSEGQKYGHGLAQYSVQEDSKNLPNQTNNADMDMHEKSEDQTPQGGEGDKQIISELDSNQAERGGKYGVETQKAASPKGRIKSRSVGENQTSDSRSLEEESYKTDAGHSGNIEEDIRGTLEEMNGKDGPKANKEKLDILIRYKETSGAQFVKTMIKLPCTEDFLRYWSFYTKTSEGKEMLDVIVRKHQCSVAVSNDDDDLFIFEVFGQCFKNESDIEEFINMVINSIYQNAQKSLCLCCFSVEVVIQDDFLQRVKQRKELDAFWIAKAGEHNSGAIYAVSRKENKESLFGKITEISDIAWKCFENHEEKVPADNIWKRVMEKFGYLEEMNGKFLKTKIIHNEKLNAFLLKGVRNETKAAAEHLEKLLKTAHVEVHGEEFSIGCQFEIFSNPEMCDYIDSLIQNIPSPFVWIPNNHTQKLHIFSRNPEYTNSIYKSIESCIQEKGFPLSRDVLSLEEIISIEELKTKHKGKVLIQPSDKAFLVTAASDIFESVYAAVQDICSQKNVTAEAGSKKMTPDHKTDYDSIRSKGLLSKKGNEISKCIEVHDRQFFKTLLKEDLSKFEHLAKQHDVTIGRIEKTNRFGFDLRGSEADVMFMFNSLSKKIKSKEQNMQHDDDIPAENVKAQMEASSPNAANIPPETVEVPLLPHSPQQGKKNQSPDVVEGGEHQGEDDNEKDEKPLSPQQGKENQSPAVVEGEEYQREDDNAKTDDPGLEQRVWSYPNGKKIMLVKATTCDADVIIIPGNSDKDGQSQFGDKKLVRLKVPDGAEGKAKTDLQDEVKQVLKQILKKTVVICIEAVEGWKFPTYLKCFLFQIKEYFMRNEAEPCPIECVILLVEDTSDYNKAMKIIQESFKLEQDKSEVFASHELLPQEQGPIFKRIQVKVIKGQLHEAQVQVLVNTVDRSLDLTKGVISSSLLEKAGNGIQRELKQYQDKVGFGEVLKTGVGTLPNSCKVIFHGVLYAYQGHSDSVKVFQDFLARCLEDANKRYRSIAFPPIGTGRLGYPKDLVASLLFQSVAKFEEAHPKSKLEEVIFVIYEKDQETLKIFEEMHRRCVDTSFGKGTKQQVASLGSSETPIPIAVTELKGLSKTVGGTAPSQMKTEVKEPVSPVITEADRSEVKERVSPVIRSEEKDIAHPKFLLPGNKQLKDILQCSNEENCCFFVCDVDEEGVRSLRRQITSPSVKAKFVYPYESRNALVICQNPGEKDTIMNKVKNKYQVQCVGPQKIQGFTAAVDPVICRKARKMKKVEDLIAKVEKKSGVTISCTDSSIQFKAVTSRQLEIAQECLIRFAKETLEINVQGRSTENSGNFINAEKIENVSQTEFLALKSLEIYSKWTQKFNIKFTHDKETLYAQGDLLYLNEERKKEIEKEIIALRGKQKTELLYDPEEIMQFRSAVDEAKSDELLLVWDDDNKQVLVYSDSYDVMQKFKHKVEFKMGRKKLTGRSGRRFAKQEDTMPLLSEEESPTKKKIARSFSWSQDATNVEVFKTLEGIMVKVYKANILRLDVDCIVNAANDNLQHGGGVALVIAKGAGPEIDREGSEILKIRGRINVGEQCVTTAGNLPYDCVIHTVGPRWSDYYPHDARNIARCETDLFNSIIGCFIEAEKRHLKSIALPAISSGIFAVPRDVCTEQYAKAVIHYSKTKTSLDLQEIHFIDMLPDIVKDMQLAFKRHLSYDGNAKHIVNSGDQTPAIKNQAGRDHGNNQHDTIPEKDIGAASPTEEKQNLAPVLPKFEETFVKEQKSHVYRPNQNMAVYIYTTDITKLTRVEAVVCSDDIRGNGYGAVASALLQIGKSTYKSVKKKAFEKEVHFGDVIVTSGGDSNFDLVIHAVVPSFKDKISPQRHRELVRICYDKILDDTNNWGKASLALPFIGKDCAELGYEGSAKLFLDSLEVFCNRATTLNLKAIYIVDKDKHTTEKIVDVFSKHTDRVRRNLVATHKSAWHPSSHTSSVGPQGEISQVKPKTPVSGTLFKEDCHICLNKLKSPKTLSCGHTFCIKCVESKPACPTCGAFHGIIYGDQPEGGEMKVTVLQFSLKGFERRDTLKIEYRIPRGKQGPNHPEPGKWFDSIYQIAYLPDTTEGKKVCDLLKVAFERRLIFTFRRSAWGVGHHVLTWNDIHHKTTLSDSGGQYGYPDSGYLQRVRGQLAAKGITEADIKFETAL